MREYCNRCNQLVVLKNGVCKFCNGSNFVYTEETLKLQFKFVIDHLSNIKSEKMDDLINQLAEITQKYLDHNDKNSK